MSNLTEHKCAGKCPEFKGGDWVVLANSVSREPSLAQILKTDGRWPIIKWLDDNTESNVRLDFLRHATDEEIKAGRRMDHFRDAADMGDDAQPLIERLKAENKMLHKAAATHLRNQNHFMDLYNRLVEQLYPYAIDLEDPVDGDVNIPKEYMEGYNRAREIAHYNLLEMMESDVEYICAQCDMLGGGGEA